MDYSVTLKIEDFKLMTEALGTISSFLTDVDIRNGIVRQYNLAKTLILNMDMSSIFNKDLCCSNVKAKIPIFEIMVADGKDVTISYSETKENRNGIDVTNKHWFLNNGVSLFRFVWTDPNKLSTKYLSDTEWNERLKGSSDDKKIVTVDLVNKPELVRKIKKVCDTFNCSDIMFRNDTTGYSLQVRSNDKVSQGKLLDVAAELGMNKTYTISTKVDFITNGIVNNISYYRPCFSDANMNEDNTKKATCYLVADCKLNEKIGFKTYNVSTIMIGDLEQGKKRKQEPVNVVQQPVEVKPEEPKVEVVVPTPVIEQPPVVPQVPVQPSPAMTVPLQVPPLPQTPTPITTQQVIPQFGGVDDFGI